MKKILFLFAMAGVMMSCQQSGDKMHDHEKVVVKTDSVAACCATKDGLFIHLSSGYESPHKVLMALKMAVMMSAHQDVLVYVDINGVDLLQKTSKDLKYKDFPTLFESLDKLAAAKVTVMACPSCMQAAGYKEEDLRPGIIIAQKDKFFNFTKGKIITIDY